MKFINNNQFQQLLEAWAASDTPPLPQGKTLKEALTPLFTRKELDIPQESTPNRSTKDIVAEAGLHAFSWNSWLYEPHEEPWVAQQLAAVHVALEDMTGLKGPVLGLNGWSSLHLDDDRQSSFGVMQISTYERTKRIGKNHFGKSFIRLSSAAGWTTLGHEWIHALDVAMHLGKRGSVAGYLSETEDTMQEWIQRMEATPQGQTSDDVARWVRGHQAALAAYKDSPSLSDEPSIPPALAIIDKIDGGEIVENLAEEYRKQNDPGYFGLWSERLAYAYNRGAQRLGGLPLLLNTVVSPWLLGTPAEQEVAGDVFQEFFASNMVKDFWQALNTSPEDSFLLDAVARRRMKRDRAYQRDKRKAAAPSA